MNKTIVLVDPFDTGHHESYMVMFSIALLSMGNRVVALYPDPEKLEKLILKKNPDNVGNLQCLELIELEPSHTKYSFIRKITDVTGRWNQVKRTIKNLAKDSGYIPDLVFFCWLDSYLYKFLPVMFVNRFPYSWSGLYFHPWHFRGYPQMSWWKRILHRPEKLIGAKNCIGIGILDEGIHANLIRCFSDKPIIVFPDVANNSTPDSNNPIIKEILKKADGRKIISLLGYLSNRKGLMSLIKVAQEYDHEGLYFVFAGELVYEDLSSTDIGKLKRFVSMNPDNCYFYFEHIATEAIYNAFVSISDVLYAVYNFFPSSSNILSKAALYKKPIIVSNKYLMGERTRGYNLGMCVAESDIDDQSKKINQILNDETEKNYGFDKYVENHSYKRLIESFYELLPGQS
jgi:glycosyltransferase involved in cell wall biosynthesis